MALTNVCNGNKIYAAAAECFQNMYLLSETERDLTQSYDKHIFNQRKIQNQRDNTKTATKIFEYTTIADRLRTVSWSDISDPTGVVKSVYERSIFPLTPKAV